MSHSVYDRPDADSVHAQYDRVIDALESTLLKVAEQLGGARVDPLACTAFPKQLRTQIRSNNPQERLDKEIRRRTDVAGLSHARSSRPEH